MCIESIVGARKSVIHWVWGNTELINTDRGRNRETKAECHIYIRNFCGSKFSQKKLKKLKIREWKQLYRGFLWPIREAIIYHSYGKIWNEFVRQMENSVHEWHFRANRNAWQYSETTSLWSNIVSTNRVIGPTVVCALQCIQIKTKHICCHPVVRVYIWRIVFHESTSIR